MDGAQPGDGMKNLYVLCLMTQTKTHWELAAVQALPTMPIRELEAVAAALRHLGRALEAAEAGCELAEGLALDPSAREACEASAAARKAAAAALQCSADGGAP